MLLVIRKGGYGIHHNFKTYKKRCPLEIGKMDELAFRSET